MTSEYVCLPSSNIRGHSQRMPAKICGFRPCVPYPVLSAFVLLPFPAVQLHSSKSAAYILNFIHVESSATV